ncbi:putative glycoside hydrolase [Methanobrevibacter sp.]|uniref:putative glycoside hydrolase n=1 Tax=Methanobrevibacter sp. TaxID=66852 RepID=UPI003866DCFA
MKNRIIFCFIILLTLFLSISAISASENVTCDNLTAVDEDFDVLSSEDDTPTPDEVNKSSTQISASNKTSYVDYQDTFTIKLTSNGTALADKPITIILDNVEYNKTTDSNGEAIINFKLKVGTYQVAYFFDGDGNYTSSNGTSTITVKSEIKTSLNLLDKTNNHCEGVKSVFNLRLVDVYGNPISGKTVNIKVGSKTYSAKTDSNGIAKFYISLKKGDNDIYYYFSEDGQYVASSGTSKIVVKSKLDKGNGYWVNKWDMKKVNLKKLAKKGTKHIFLLHTVFKKYGKKSVLKWIKKAHKYGMKVHMWICAFYNGGYVLPCNKKGHFNYKQMNKVIKKSKYYAKFKEIDGIHFDYTRFPGNAYKYKNAVKAVNYFIEKACSSIRDVRPGIIISSAVMPEPNDMKHYYAQDISTMSKHLDVLVPMVYKGNYHAGDKWIKKTTKAFVKKSKGAQIWTGLQSYKSDSNIKKLSYKALFKDAKYSLKGGATGVMIFRWGLSALLNFKKL